MRSLFVASSLLLVLVACIGDEATPGYTAPPTKAEYVKACREGACPPTEENCSKAFACQVDLFSSYKVRDVMQCQSEQNACFSCVDRVAETKYSKDAGEMILACKKAEESCKGFSCPSALRLYRDDLLKNLTACYDAGCTKEDPYKVAKCLNITAFAKAPNCQTSCCAPGANPIDPPKFYACPNLDAARACFGGTVTGCEPVESLDGLCKL